MTTKQDEHAAHRRRALLDQVPLRAVSTNLLADVAHPQQADPEREESAEATSAKTTARKTW